MTGVERALAVKITGQVQGVGYRAWTQAEAMRLGIHGWVVNRAGGHVEAVLMGPGDRLAELIALCRTGPTAARVDHVDARSIERSAGAEAPSDAMLF